jgi:undecaprenyl-diphosphatase
VFRSLPSIVVLAGYWAAGRSRHTRRTIVAAFLSSLLAGLLSRFIQNMWHTPRPVHDPVVSGFFHPPFLMLIDKDFHSFPSDHAAFLLPLVWYVSRLQPWLGAAAIALAGATLLARLYLGLHFPVDVAVGLMAGAVSVLATERLWPRLVDRIGALVYALESRWPVATASLLFLLAYAYATMFDDFRSLALAFQRALTAS